MAGTILLDTDVLVDFLRGYSKAMAFVNAHSARIILSSIVVAELYAGVKGEAEQAALENFISLFNVVPVSVKIAKAGGLYRRAAGNTVYRIAPYVVSGMNQTSARRKGHKQCPGFSTTSSSIF